MNFLKQTANCFRYQSIKLSFRSVLNNLSSLHGMSFTRACLPISKYSTMISFNGSINHSINLTPVVDIFLGVIFWEKVVKMKRSTIGLLCDVYLFFLMIYCDFAICVTIFHLGRQEGSHSNSCFYFVWHINFILIYKINNTIIGDTPLLFLFLMWIISKNFILYYLKNFIIMIPCGIV